MAKAVSSEAYLEAALNDIGNVRRSRGLPRKFSDYLSVLLVGPVLVFAAFAIIASLRSSSLVQRLLQITRTKRLHQACQAVRRPISRGLGRVGRGRGRDHATVLEDRTYAV